MMAGGPNGVRGPLAPGFDRIGVAEPPVGRRNSLRPQARLSSVLGVERPLTAKESRTLALHRLVAVKFAADSDLVRSIARRNLRLQRRVHGARSARYTEAWALLVDGSDDDLVAALVDLSEEGRALRQASPFSGVLEQSERLEALAEARSG